MTEETRKSVWDIYAERLGMSRVEAKARGIYSMYGINTSVSDLRQLVLAYDDAAKSGDDVSPVDFDELNEKVSAGHHFDDPVDVVGDVAAFHMKFGHPPPVVPRFLTQEELEFRVRFVDEEFKNEYVPSAYAALFYLGRKELNREKVAEELEKQLDSLVDTLYVVVGTALWQFPPAVVREAWRRVQRANMAKVRATHASQSARGSTLDVVKPQGWTPPDHGDLVAVNAHSGETS